MNGANHDRQKSVPAPDCFRPILLKNSPTSCSATFAGVLRPSPTGRSSILGRSERSSSRGERSFDGRIESYNKIGHKEPVASVTEFSPQRSSAPTKSTAA